MIDSHDVLEAPKLPRNFNAATHFIDKHVDTAHGQKIAIIDDEGRYSYAQLVERVNRAGNALVDLGLARESRVALIMNDSIEFVAAFWGAIKAGLVPVPINTLLTTDRYEYILGDCRASALLVSEALFTSVGSILHSQECLQHVVIANGECRNHISWTTLLQNAAPSSNPAATVADEVAFWLYSSGSTGDPKGVKHVHSSLVYTAECYGKQVLRIEANDIVYSAAKLFFAYGLGNGMTFPLNIGATVVLTAQRPTPEVVLAILQRERVSLYFGVPTLYAAILSDESAELPAAHNRLRVCVSAGEALPQDIGVRWEARFGVPILDGVGSTEMLHIFLSNRIDNYRYGTSGLAVPGYKLALIDDNGAAVIQGEIGELIVNGDSSAEAYWNRRDKTRRTFVGEWTYTGDKYYIDVAGYYCFCGRSDDMFKSGGNWVSPFDVEAVLIQHASVLEAAVVGHPDEHGNIKPRAFVVLKDGSSGSSEHAEILQAHVKQHTELWKYPRWVDFCEALPKTATGKIQRFKLRQGPS